MPAARSKTRRRLRSRPRRHERAEHRAHDLTVGRSTLYAFGRVGNWRCDVVKSDRLPSRVPRSEVDQAADSLAGSPSLPFALGDFLGSRRAPFTHARADVRGLLVGLDEEFVDTASRALEVRVFLSAGRLCRLPARWDHRVASDMGPRRVHVDRRA